MDTNLNYGKLNNDKINIHEYYEVEYWTKILDTNAEALKKAVHDVGSSVNEVKKYLKK